jgi:TatD DNase family protein
MNEISLVDSHVHLDRFPDEEVSRMVSEAEQAGVHRLLTIGTDLDSSRAALRLAGQYPSVLAAVGIHPTRLHTLGAGQRPIRLLGGLLREGAVSAIGEVGLDAGAPNLEMQRQFLAACVQLAAEHDLPLVLHVVGEAAIHTAALTILPQQPAVRVVAHYFVGGPELAARYLEAGCWISVGRPATRPSEAAVRAAVQMIPLDRLLLETDTYPLPGRTTEPRDVSTVCAAVAELTGRPYAEVAQVTTANFSAFIGKKGD